MNEKARQLQLSSTTQFVNATGLPNAQSKEKRMIFVVMGANEDIERFKETKKLLSYGFHKVYIPFDRIVFNIIYIVKINRKEIKNEK